MPGLEVRPLLDELRARIAEEIDYRLEATSSRPSRPLTRTTRTSTCRRCCRPPTTCSITEWMDGTPLARIIEDGRARRNATGPGYFFTRFLFSGPARAGLLHADPHPGNFRMLANGRLGVLDFGAVDRLPNGLPPFIGKLLRDHPH